MSSFTDQTGRTVVLPHPPRRIVSLVPSITELLYDLGLSDEVVGITKFCIHPEAWFRRKTRVGGTKTVNANKIGQLQPDLIIANKEENIKEQVEALAGRYPVWVSDVSTLEDATGMIGLIGDLTNTTAAANRIRTVICDRFHSLEPPGSGQTACYLIWKDPYMSVGGDTFIHDMLARCGFQNLYGHLTRYPVVTIEQLRVDDCKLLLLSSEPFPFKEKHRAELQKMLPDCRILLVDGEFFSWYGSRLMGAPAYFGGLAD